jgi:hypothetical protein
MRNQKSSPSEIIQQGDVQLFPQAIPAGMEKVGGNIIQEGEHTGHAHRLYDGDYQIFDNPKTKERWLRVVSPVSFGHEEHHGITIPPGDYRIGIIQQWDYDTEESKRVVD